MLLTASLATWLTCATSVLPTKRYSFHRYGNSSRLIADSTYELWLFCGFWVPQGRSAPVNSGLHCGLRNSIGARQRRGSLRHTHPPPDPCTSIRVAAVWGPSSAATIVTSSCIGRGSLSAGPVREGIFHYPRCGF